MAIAFRTSSTASINSGFTSVASKALVLSSNIIAGDTVFVAGMAATTGSTTTMALSGGSVTWTPAGSVALGGSAGFSTGIVFQLWEAVAVAGTIGATVTLTPGVSGALDLISSAYSGAGAKDIYPTPVVAVGSTGITTLLTPAGTTTLADWILCLLAIYTTSTATVTATKPTSYATDRVHTGDTFFNYLDLSDSNTPITAGSVGGTGHAWSWTGAADGVSVLYALKPAGGTAFAIAGTASQSSHATGSLAWKATIGGTASQSSHSTGSLAQKMVFSGAASTTSHAAGALAWKAKLSGTASNTSHSTGSLAWKAALAGTASTTSHATGAVSIVKFISGTASQSSHSSGSFAQKMVIAGTAHTTPHATGALAWKAKLSGNAAFNTSHATGALAWKAKLSGTASNTSHATGAITNHLKISGTGHNTSTASGHLAWKIKLSGIAFNTSTATGSLVRPPLSISGTAFNGSVATGVFVAPARSPLHLGGSLSIFELGGSLTVVDTLGGSLVGPGYGGSLVVVDLNYAGSITEPNFAGTLTVVDTLGGNVTVPLNLGGTEGQWTMQEIDITLNEFNDMTLTALLTSSGSPVNITSAEIDMFLKTQAGVADGDASTVKLSTTTGEITITNPTGGGITVVIPDSDNNSLDFGFYRIDIVTASGTLRNTALFGKVTIIPL